MLKTLVMATMAVGLAACSSESETGSVGVVDPVEHTVSVSEALKPSCPSWGCGENSPLLGPHRMEELSWDGAPNPKSGVRILGFVIGTTEYTTEVVGDRLIAHLKTNPAVTMSGTGLVNGYFRIYYPADPKTGLLAGTAQLIIKSVSEMQLWLGPSQYTSTYELVYTGADAVGQHPLPICKNPPPIYKPGTTTAMVEGHIVPNAYQALLFTGDRYDIDSKRVTAASYASAGHWFNIACAGSSVVKLHLNRHTTASAVAGWTTNLDQRQTMLKMYTGDFCGTGEAYTEQGTKIHWKNNLGWSSPPGNDTTYESLWNRDGAVCLTTHRLHNLPTINNDNYQVEIQGDKTASPPIVGNCPKPACPPVPDLLSSGQYILTQSTGTP